MQLAEGEAPGAEAHWHWTSESYPADAISLRSISSDNFVVVDTTDHTRVIGETDFTSAPSTLHEKAIYLVEGALYQVERLDFDNRKAFVRQVDCDYYTDAIRYDRVTILDTFESAPDAPVTTRPPAPASAESLAPWAHGEVHVVSRVVGFKKIKFYTNENVGSGELDLPEQEMHTTGCWLTIPRQVMTSLPYGGDDRRDGVIGLATAMRQIAQFLLMCDRHDLGVSIGSSGALEAGSPALGRSPGSELDRRAADGVRQAPVDYDEPRVFVYDNYPGGIGLAEPLFRMRGAVLERTRALIGGCPCQSGCPSCVGPLGDVGPRAKDVALDILARIA